MNQGIADTVDLHVHTTASDGSFTPSEIVSMAAAAGLAAVAVTDHDTVSGIEEALAAGRALGLEVVPGIEIGVLEEAARDLVDVDILGYFIGHEDPSLQEALRRTRESRRRWVSEQIAVLEAAGFHVPEEDVWKEVGRSPTPRRPHVRKVLERHNPGRLPAPDFFRFTDFGEKYFVKKRYEICLEECVALIRGAGGVAVLAHPADYPKIKDKESLVRTCRDAGVEGVEVHYPYRFNRIKCTEEEERAVADRYARLAASLGLAATGGSDFHGDVKPEVALGMMRVPVSCLENLKAVLARRTARPERAG